MTKASRGSSCWTCGATVWYCLTQEELSTVCWCKSSFSPFKHSYPHELPAYMVLRAGPTLAQVSFCCLQRRRRNWESTYARIDSVKQSWFNKYTIKQTGFQQLHFDTTTGVLRCNGSWCSCFVGVNTGNDLVINCSCWLFFFFFFDLSLFCFFPGFFFLAQNSSVTQRH